MDIPVATTVTRSKISLQPSEPNAAAAVVCIVRMHVLRMGLSIFQCGWEGEVLLLLIHPSIPVRKKHFRHVDVSILLHRSFDKFERRLSETQFRDGLNSAEVTDRLCCGSPTGKDDVSSVRESRSLGSLIRHRSASCGAVL